MSVNQNILNKNRSFRFQYLGMKKKFQIVIVFKIQDIIESKTVQIFSTSMTFPTLKHYVKQLQDIYITNKIPLDRLLKFVKHEKKFIPFDKLQLKDEYQLLSKERICVQYLYKNKRDQAQRKLANLEQQVSQKLDLLKEIVQAQKSRPDVLKKLASNDSGLQVQNALEVKIRIILYISDPLVRKKNIPVGNEELNVNDHVNILQSASNLHQSLSISVEKSYAIYDSGKMNLQSVLEKGQKSHINIVHFFINVVKDKEEFYLIFQGRNNLFGEEVYFKVNEFFQKVKNSSISLLIFIGTNVDLLREMIPKDLQFSILLLTTYSPNKQESFKSLIRMFYENLFNRCEMNESLKNAIMSYQKQYASMNTWRFNYVCCCLHEHKQNCAWTKIVELIGKSLAHKLFFHNEFKSKANVLMTIMTFQSIILEYFSIKFESCGDGANFCCQPSHKVNRQSDIMNKKVLLFPKPTSLIFASSHSSQEFKQNVFHTKFLSDKIFQSFESRRCPLILFKIVRNILQDKNKIIQIVGSRRIGKGQFIQAACKYIQNRQENYWFQKVDENQCTLKECLNKIFSKAQKLKEQNKTVVFIHPNKGMMIEKENIKQFYQKSNEKLPFTFLIKLNSQQEETSSQLLLNPSFSNYPSTITLPKLNNLEIFCQIVHEMRKKSFFQNQKTLYQIFAFCDHYAQKITFKEIRNFLEEYGKEDRISWNSRGKTLMDKFNLIEQDFQRKIKSQYVNNKKLYDFLGFISLFPQGFYLTKLTRHLIKQILQIQQLQELIKSKEILGKYFQIFYKPTRNRRLSTKVQKNYFILPNDKVINYFRNLGNSSKKYNQMKLDFFHSFFNLMEALIFKYENILRKVYKRQRIFLEEGIFMFNYWKGRAQQDLFAIDMAQRHQIIYKNMNNVWKTYQTQIDDKIMYEYYDKKNQGNKVLTPQQKKRFIQEKILQLILHESQRFVLCRHIPAIASLISTYFDKNITHQHQSQKITQNQKERKCPIVFYRKIIFVCKILLKEPIKYELIESKLKSLQPKLLQYLQQKGTQYLQRQIHHPKHKRIEPSLNKTSRSFQELNQLTQEKDLALNKYQHGVTFKSYLSKLINYLQIKIILNRRQQFSLSFGDRWGKRKSFNPSNQQRQVQQKSTYLKELQRSLPKLEKQAKSESDLQNGIKNFSYLAHKKSLQSKSLNQVNEQYTTEDLILMILNELMIYESEENSINYFCDEEPVLKTICNQIQVFKNILEILGWISLKLKNQNQKNWFFKSLNKEQITMQILRLCMRKIEIHFKLKKSEKDESKVRIKRNIDLKGPIDLEQSSKFLKASYNDPKNPYYQNERVGQFLKNFEICTKYINFICKNDKVTEQFTTSIGDVDTQYKDIFSYLCQQTWKKTLFNEQNNIIFFKSKALGYNGKPYTYVRKSNVTMKYMIKILSEFKINITFLHLTQNNFNYIQRDKDQNPNCKIKYLVLTVDMVKQNGEWSLIFQDEKNITHKSVKASQFLFKMNQVVVDFIIVMGSNAILLAKDLNLKLQGNPITIGIESPIYSLKNFVKYPQSSFINQMEEFQPNAFQNSFVNQIYQYMNLESYHCILDMIVCSLITDMVNLPYKKQSKSKNLPRAVSQILCTKNKILEFLAKQRDIAKGIMADKWPNAKQISIEFDVFFEESISLRRNYSSLSSIETTESLQLNQRLSSRDSIECIKYFPFFQKGFIVDNTTKIYDSQLQVEDYYENVNRNQDLCEIMKFIQQPGRKIVQIYGSKGAGKTSFLKQICWMNFIYKTFKDGVFMIDVEKLCNSSQTILQNIDIVYKQSKLFSLMQDFDIYPKYQTSTILLALDNINLTSIRENSDFFEKIRGKPICVLYSTDETNLESELNNYFKIHHLDKEKYKKSHMQDDEIIHLSPNKQKNSTDKRFNQHSHSMELQNKKITQQSEPTLDNQQKQQWTYLKININILTKNALFNIALSYLKKKEFKTLKMGMPEFIMGNFAKFVINIIERVSSQVQISLPQRLNQFDPRRNSQRVSTLHQQGSIQLQRRVSQGTVDFQRTISSVHNSQHEGTYFLNQAQIFENPTLSNLPKLLNLMNEYFKNLTVQKVVKLNISSLENDNQAQMIPLIQSLDDSMLHEKKDTRLWFYENCFQELMKAINAYDSLEVVFR